MLTRQTVSGKVFLDMSDALRRRGEQTRLYDKHAFHCSYTITSNQSRVTSSMFLTTYHKLLKIRRVYLIFHPTPILNVWTEKKKRLDILHY